MVGAGINVIPIMVQRSVPGIGPHVLLAYALAALPVLLAGLAYAALASAMPRAGGGYVYASRGLHPYAGFLAGFSQWLGLSFAMGVVAFVLVPFLRDAAASLGAASLAQWLGSEGVRLGLSLMVLWSAALLNLVGIRIFERAVVLLMLLALAGGVLVVPLGFAHDHADFAAALAAAGEALPAAPEATLAPGTLFAAVALLFSSFIGFDSIAQAGGEARDPQRTLPLAIGISVLGVGAFYLAFTAAVYHAVPWAFVAERARDTDLTAPGLLGYLVGPGWTLAMLAGAAVGLFNSLPGMLLAVSRLVFAWAEDGVAPASLAAIHPRWRTPHVAILASTLVGTLGVLGCHLAGDFFLGVDLLVTGMLVNFALICATLLTLPRRSPALQAQNRVLPGRVARVSVGFAGLLLLLGLLAFHVGRDLAAEVDAWYLHSTWSYLVFAGAASAGFAWRWRRLAAAGVDLASRFRELPPD
jgi:amino acid transporter